MSQSNGFGSGDCPNTRASPLSTKRCVDNRECSAYSSHRQQICLVVNPILPSPGKEDRDDSTPGRIPRDLGRCTCYEAVYVSPETGSTD